MTRALVMFDSARGPARAVAEEIARGISSTGRVLTTVRNATDMPVDRILDFDIIVIGSRSHPGTVAGSVDRLIRRLPPGRLVRKTVSLFDLGTTRDAGVTVHQLRLSLEHRDPTLHLASPGISVLMEGPGGPIRDGELSRCREFGERLADAALA